MPITLLVARLLLAAVFLVASVAKLTDRPGARRDIVDLGLPSSLASPFSILLPLAELAVAVALIPTGSGWWGALGALFLLLVFLIGIGITLARGETPDCHCFGQLHSEPVGWKTLIRNGVLALVAGLVVWQGKNNPGPSAFGWLGDLTTGEEITLIVGVVGFVILAVEAWFIVHLLQQQGRLLLRLDGLQAAMAGQGAAPLAAGNPAPPAGLPAGTPAPPFELPDLDGMQVSLDSLRAAGKPVMLLFTDPNCGPCSALLPDVVRWQGELGAALTIALISSGGIEANRSRFGEHEISHVLVQEEREVANAYRALGTPSAVVVQPDGTIGSSLAPGADAIRALLARVLGLPSSSPIPLLAEAPTRVPGAQDGNGHAPPPALKVGDPAPPLRLPDLDGKPIDLADFQGSETVVLFWNPGCGFCQKMLPDLRAWEGHRPEGAPRLLVVSTGTVDANEAQGIQSPVVLDQDFGVGQAFGANGTPMAVLVDAEGRIASELAAGAPAVLALVQAGAIPA